ncbi:DUF551 domain-containing protein [Escherichia coli]|uniref:DUF551 domain-containing protein n=1 Tax=Escherichia coli TaxID=562 RepID=UPI000BE428D6|nr:DUF551 domain-containing protein [Escherichia coli]
MSTITREWLQQAINDYESVRDELPFGLDDYQGNILAALRIALASLEADPVKRVNSDQMRRVCLEANRHLDKYDAMAKEVNKLLGRIAPPAPVVPEEISTTHTMLPAMSDQLMAFGYVKGWNACRAAMLQGKSEQPQNAQQNIPENIPGGNSPVTPDGWISCSERMPSEEDVLVYCSDTKEQMVGFHKGKGLFQFFYMNGVEGVCEPSHWMPLPEPPL